ncbi:hypothetical protein ACIRF8_09330 [Streptomyces sp. NPDC102406]|uniref:hypothetical protein n=1 Tax=Streptomyces sp. NPDC102406 TaxID=3366171 RepID=UPI0038003195
MGAGAEEAHPVLGRRRGVYRPRRRGPAAYVRLVLALIPFAGLAYLLTLLLGALVGWDGATPAQVVGLLALLVPFGVRAQWYRRHARVELRLYERGLAAVAADGSETVYTWASAAVFWNGAHHYKVCNPEGKLITLGAADRLPMLGGERIRGVRTRTVIRGAQVPREEEWGPAILAGVERAQSASAAVERILGGSEVTFGQFVLSRAGLAVRRRHGRSDFTAWEDIDSLDTTDDGGLLISSRGNDFPTLFMGRQYQVPGLGVFLDVVGSLRARADQDVGQDVDQDEESEVSEQLALYVTCGVSLWALWHLGSGSEIDGLGSALLAVLRGVLGAVVGAVLGLGLSAAVMVVPRAGGTFLLEPFIRWLRHGRYVAAAVLAFCVLGPPVALLFVLFRAFPSHLVPMVVLLFFGGWTLLLAVRRCLPAERAVVRHLPDLPGVLLVVLALEQLVSGDVLTTAPAAGLFFPLAVWLSWRGWRKLKDSPRPTVQAAADIVLSVELGLVLTVLLVWLANVLSFAPAQVTVVRALVEQVQGLTEVDWRYWLAAYTLLAVGSYVVLRWPERIARVRGRLRPARFAGARLPLGLTANFGRRSLSGINVGIMVALLFLVVLAPVSEGTWKHPVAERYALEVQRQQYAEGSAAAYEEIHRHVMAHPRDAARIRDVVLAVQRAAPSRRGEPVNGTALDIARQVGRFQGAAITPDDPAPSPPDQRPEPEADDLDGRLDQLDEAQRGAAEREQRTDRFAELASLAITRTFDALDLGDNQVVALVKEYLGGMVEDGPVKKLFLRWGERVGQEQPPDGDRLVRIDVRRLTTVAYERTAAAVARADAGLLAFYGRFGFGAPAEDTSLTPAVDLANQHRYLRQGTGSCSGCVHSTTDGSRTGGGGGGGRR